MSGEVRPRPRWLAPPVPPDEQERLAALHNYNILDTPPEQAFDDLTWLASHFCDTPMALVTLIDRDRQWFKSRVGFASRESPRSESICAHAILTPDKLLEVPDCGADDRFADMPAIAGDPFVRFYAGAPLVDTDGHAVGTLCVMDRVPRALTDDQRHALRALAAQAMSQFELHVRLRAVEDRRAYLHSVINALPIAVVIRDKSGSIALKNDAASQFAGESGPALESFTIIGKKGTVIPKERWPGVRALSGENVVGEELIIRTPDGRETPVLGTAAPVRDSRGVIVASAISYQDITPLAEVAKLKDDFVATVSHELRTPLTAIKGSMQLLHADLTDPDHLELVSVALSNADRLVRMVSDILDTAKIEAGALILQRRTMTVAALGQTAIENVRSIAAAARVRLAIEVDPGVRVVHVDVDRMVQAIVNLLSNAIKFAPTGSTVTFGARSMPDGGVAMTVHDAGDGIPPDRLHRLFQKFSQLDSSSTNQGKGTGLGLSITKALVEEHGGTIHVTSSREDGTTFEIRLGGDGSPFAQAAAQTPSNG